MSKLIFASEWTKKMKMSMRTILMAVIVAMGLQMQAQETLCDYTYTVGTQDEFEIAIPITGNGLPNMAPLYAYTYVGEYMMEDSCFGGPCTHIVYNSILADTATTCIDYTLTDSLTGEMDTLNCCFDQVWDATSETWFKLSSSVGVHELQMEEAGDDKFYDLMGRELPEAPIGQIYIQNRKRHFRFE